MTVKRSISLIALSLALVLTRASALEVGKPAPDFTGTDSKGKSVTLSKLKGKYVVLEWYNTGCPFVRKHYDSKNMQTLQKKYAKKGVTWLSIISSAAGKEGYLSPADAEADKKKQGAAPTATLIDADGTIGKLYEAKTTPHMFIVDPKGNLVYMGAIDDKRSVDPEDVKGAKNYVAQALDQALAGKPITESTTAPYGCSVKYK